MSVMAKWYTGRSVVDGTAGTRRRTGRVEDNCQCGGGEESELASTCRCWMTSLLQRTLGVAGGQDGECRADKMHRYDTMYSASVLDRC